jgi:hypothetical protein
VGSPIHDVKPEMNRTKIDALEWMIKILLLWSEGDWRCELYPAAGAGAFLKIFRGEHLVVIESTFVGGLAFKRAEILRNVFCGARKAQSTD